MPKVNDKLTPKHNQPYASAEDAERGFAPYGGMVPDSSTQLAAEMERARGRMERLERHAEAGNPDALEAYEEAKKDYESYEGILDDDFEPIEDAPVELDEAGEPYEPPVELTDEERELPEGDPDAYTIEPGEELKRFKPHGYDEDHGRYMAVGDASEQEVARGQVGGWDDITNYEVVKPFDVVGTEAAPWKNDEGGAQQVVPLTEGEVPSDPEDVQWLLDNGYIQPKVLALPEGDEPLEDELLEESLEDEPLEDELLEESLGNELPDDIDALSDELIELTDEEEDDLEDVDEVEEAVEPLVDSLEEALPEDDITEIDAPLPEDDADAELLKELADVPDPDDWSDDDDSDNGEPPDDFDDFNE